MKEGNCSKEMCGSTWRIGISAASGIGWLMFLVYWLFFLADGYSLYQNIGIFILSVLALALVNALAWLPFGLKQGRKHAGKD